MRRRCILRSGLMTGELALLAQCGLLWPTRLLATWPADAFHEADFERALSALVGGEAERDQAHARLEAKSIAENGASVPLAVHTDLQGPVSVSLFSVGNPFPALGRFELAPELGGYLATRVKMAGSGDLVAVVSTGDRHFSDRRRIQVTAGGCG